MLDWIDASTKRNEYAAGFAIDDEGKLVTHAKKLSTQGAAA